MECIVDRPREVNAGYDSKRQRQNKCRVRSITYFALAWCRVNLLMQTLKGVSHVDYTFINKLCPALGARPSGSWCALTNKSALACPILWHLILTRLLHFSAVPFSNYSRPAHLCLCASLCDAAFVRGPCTLRNHMTTLHLSTYTDHSLQGRTSISCRACWMLHALATS
jgi:hypothetical protein